MATNISTRLNVKARNEYLDLFMKFPLTSIRSDDELEAAQEVMDGLLTKGKLSAVEQMYLDTLSDLVAVFEDKHYQFDSASDAEMLRHLMDAKGISQIELHRGTKIAKSTISEILAKKKPFSRQIIGTLAKFFDVDKSVLTSNL